MRSLREFHTFLTISRWFGVALAALSVSACSATTAPPIAGVGSAATGASRSAGQVGGPRLAAAQCPAAVVYVVAPQYAAVEVYDPAHLAAGPCGQVTGVRSPQGIFVDADANLWVADAAAQNVYEFSPGVQQPVQTLSDPNGVPNDVVVDAASGTVYVVDYQNNVNPNTLVELYANGSTTPTGTLSDSNARNGGYAAVDNAGNLYVTFMTQANKAQVDRWTGGSGNPQDLGLQLISAGGIATTARGALAVCDPFHFRCGIFKSGSTNMTNIFGHMGRRGGSASPDKPPWLHSNTLALSSDERLAYVTSNVMTTWKYPPPANHPNHLPLQQIKVPGSSGQGIAVSPADAPGAPF
jgi:hypothetical protein